LTISSAGPAGRHAQQTWLLGNTGGKNRLDLCDDGVGTVSSGSAFATSAAPGGTDCVIAH
jgi:hypothetical protein